MKLKFYYIVVKLILLFFIINNSRASVSNKVYHRYYDYTSNYNIYRHLSTKTPYWILSREDDSNDSITPSLVRKSSNNQNDRLVVRLESTEKEIVEKEPLIINDLQSSGSSSGGVCKIVHFNFLARHGSRLPVAGAIKKLQLLPQSLDGYGDKIVEQYKWILNWTVPYPTTTAGNLILQGQYEHYNISKRFRQRYPEFFQHGYLPSRYPIQSTAISRVGISANSFAYGLFEGTGQLGSENFEPVFIKTSTLDSDNLLRFFDTCQTYRHLIDSNVINKDQQTLWNTKTFPNISLEISQKLGLQDVWEPTINVIDNIFSACAYELSISNDDSHWCSLLSKENILNWEYSQDLSNYWMKSYGNVHNYKISSILLKDILNTMDGFVYGNNTSSSSSDLSSSSNSDSISSSSSSSSSSSIVQTPPRTILRFAHAETVIPFLTLLGLYNDTFTLMANSTAEQIANRKFRTSIISPYASNIGFFLLDCGEEGFKIKIEHNELAIQIPGCDSLYCDYSQFTKLFEQVRQFDWNDYCDISSGQPHKDSQEPSVHSSSNDDKSNQTLSNHNFKLYMAIFIPLSFIIGILTTVAVLMLLKSKNSQSVDYSQLFPINK
ncbi:multiple inositol polyphosphate phosphatase [Tieghemostelium lacteum]|uniref:Multiple inositol polyphosphate phosphatase 1 n=1 Tax=Tieghemostelium lacteum TaxID=361077 RepID=A0A151ZRV4_TIELA|nr:multiple inositol polyphosphate phosphatase [Tieghemostelium lacteum]|eukprot:KYQ96649.1 multiple inositol polyphosphate phosphatase [Tieghemostelium lacteum]